MTLVKISHSRLLAVLDYSPITGEFVWKLPMSRRVKAGGIAGNQANHGYITIMVDGIVYYAHVLAWFYVKGVWPTKLIDHKSGVRNENWFDNLRESDHASNAQNCRKHSDNQCGYKGVAKNYKKFSAKIRVSGKTLHLGSFNTPEEAALVYDQAATKHFGEFALTNRKLGLIT